PEAADVPACATRPVGVVRLGGFVEVIKYFGAGPTAFTHSPTDWDGERWRRSLIRRSQLSVRSLRGLRAHFVENLECLAVIAPDGYGCGHSWAPLRGQVVAPPGTPPCGRARGFLTSARLFPNRSIRLYAPWH